MIKGVRLPNDYITTPDHASLDSEDISFIIKYAADDWNDATGYYIFGRRITGTTGSWFGLRIVGTNLRLYDNAGTFSTISFDLGSIFTDGEVGWVGLTIDGDNGAAGSNWKLWTSPNGITWTQRGTTQVRGLYGAASDYIICFPGGPSSGSLPGVAYEAYYHTGIGDNSAPGLGTLVADWSAPHSGIRHRDSTGKIWTITGSTYSTVIEA